MPSFTKRLDKCSSVFTFSHQAWFLFNTFLCPAAVASAEALKSDYWSQVTRDLGVARLPKRGLLRTAALMCSSELGSSHFGFPQMWAVSVKRCWDLMFKCVVGAHKSVIPIFESESTNAIILLQKLYKLILKKLKQGSRKCWWLFNQLFLIWNLNNAGIFKRPSYHNLLHVGFSGQRYFSAHYSTGFTLHCCWQPNRASYIICYWAAYQSVTLLFVCLESKIQRWHASRWLYCDWHLRSVVGHSRQRREEEHRLREEPVGLQLWPWINLHCLVLWLWFIH